MTGRWISVENRLPEKGKTVLVWYGDGPAGYDLACIGEDGDWTKKESEGEDPPTHWMSLPDPPGTICKDDVLRDIRGEITDDRLMLDIDEEKETVAVLMQHFIDGKAAVINGERFFVVDMKNEIAGEDVASVFYLKKATG